MKEILNSQDFNLKKVKLELPHEKCKYCKKVKISKKGTLYCPTWFLFNKYSGWKWHRKCDWYKPNFEGIMKEIIEKEERTYE